MTNKTCTRCKETKGLFDFSAHKSSADGRTSQCKECRNAQVREWRAKNPDYHSTKAKEAYYADPEHYRARAKKWRELNPERTKESLADWFRRNRQVAVEKAKPRLRKWKTLNPGKVNADTAKRHASKTKSTPAWADTKLIRELYVAASSMRKRGDDVHVDHIVPLRSQIVCGLHVQWNLRIIESKQNMIKGNREWPDMP